MKKCLILLVNAALILLPFAARPADAQTQSHPKYDYPTAARADYVIGCLASNGFQRTFLQQCACEIDTIANLMSYDDYDEASTVLSLQQGGLGERGALFRNTPVAKTVLAELHTAQAEATLRCM
jgi:hypothetical protein